MMEHPKVSGQHSAPQMGDVDAVTSQMRGMAANIPR